MKTIINNRLAGRIDMEHAKWIEWEDTRGFERLTDFDKRIAARLYADLMPLEAFTTGLLDHLSIVCDNQKEQKALFEQAYLEHLEHYNLLWKYGRFLTENGLIKPPPPSATIRQILAFAGKHIEDMDGSIALWLVLVCHKLSTLYASLSVSELGVKEPVIGSIFRCIASDEPLFFEFGMKFFKANRRRFDRDTLTRLGGLQKNFLSHILNCFSLPDNFISLQEALSSLEIEFEIELGAWAAMMDKGAAISLFIPTEERITTALKNIGAQKALSQWEKKAVFS